jgi:hypothetical protein
MADDSATSTVGIRRASGTYENALIGVITDQAGVTVGQGDQPVALTGRIPAKVTNKNGAIKVGDPITSSDIPGVGMRATEPGRVVGIALQSYDNANVGLITVFVNPSWYSGPAPTSGPAANSLTITDNSLLDFKSSALTGIGSILAANGSWSVTADGHLTAATVEAQTVTAEAFVVRQTDQSQTTGEGTIAGGSNAMVVHNAAALSNSRVFVTFEGNPGGGWWVAEQGTGDFTIHLVSPAGSDLPFRYWIMNVDDQRTTATTMTDSGTSTTPTAPATSPTDSGTSTDLTGSATGTP